MKPLLRIAAVALMGVAALVAQAHGAKVGDIDIGHPYARATAPGQPAGGAYLRLENHGAADRLVSVRTPAAGMAQLHSSRMEGNVMRMREVDAIDVPAGQTVTLAPGGLHIMLMGLKEPLKAGAKFPMTLRFEKAGEVTVEVVVQPVDGGVKTH